MKQELRYPERGEAVFICDVPDQAKNPVESIPEDRIKGGDLGLERFLTLSEGSLSNYPTTQFCHSCLEWVRRISRRGSTGARTAASTSLETRTPPY
ncbi:MAG: hypothetical protein HA492_00890 [Candidatus Verstraetearchaeota archaeon]|nr:hypothetical protein [Candidatus Verstraetearchaeota archaeon]